MPYVVEVRLEPEGLPIQFEDPEGFIDDLSPEQAIDEFWEIIEGSSPDPEMTKVLYGAIEAAQRGEQ